MDKEEIHFNGIRIFNFDEKNYVLTPRSKSAGPAIISCKSSYKPLKLFLIGNFL